jgi:HSP20 family protein
MGRMIRSADFPVFDLRREIDQLFDNFFVSPNTSITQGAGTFQPSLEISEDEKGYVLSAELPGLSEKDVSVEASGDVLTIRGEKTRETSGKKGGYEYSERSYGQFTRSLQLPPGTDASKIDATVKDGVLKVAIPKSEAQSARAIPVKSLGTSERADQGTGNRAKQEAVAQTRPPQR